MNEYLKNKSQEEIERAATFWFMGQECYLRGEEVPSSVFLLSTEGLTPEDIEWANKLIEEHPEWNYPIIDKSDVIYDGFGSAWSLICPECERKTMEVVRPGKAQCRYCG